MWRRKVWAVGVVFAFCCFGMTPSVAADELAKQADEATEAPDGEDEEDASAAEGPEGEERDDSGPVELKPGTTADQIIGGSLAAGAGLLVGLITTVLFVAPDPLGSMSATEEVLLVGGVLGMLGGMALLPPLVVNYFGNQHHPNQHLGAYLGGIVGGAVGIAAFLFVPPVEFTPLFFPLGTVLGSVLGYRIQFNMRHGGDNREATSLQVGPAPVVDSSNRELGPGLSISGRF